MSAPSHVCFAGIEPFDENADEIKVRGIAVFQKLCGKVSACSNRAGERVEAELSTTSDRASAHSQLAVAASPSSQLRNQGAESPHSREARRTRGRGSDNSCRPSRSPPLSGAPPDTLTSRRALRVSPRPRSTSLRRRSQGSSPTQIAGALPACRSPLTVLHLMLTCLPAGAHNV